MNEKKTAPGVPGLLSWLRGRAVGILALMAVAFLFLPAKAGAAELLTYTVVAKEGRFIPSMLNVPAGVRFKIVVRNQGHDAIEFESLQLRKEKVLAPGAESFMVIAPLKPGEYDFFDEFHPDTGRSRIVVK
ncbi:cupredoxin domain-containing protein [Thiobacillus denitrificans]|nr:cupredoxin domain-containing protein [Thiobacillus denitrificans]